MTKTTWGRKGPTLTRPAVAAALLSALLSACGGGGSDTGTGGTPAATATLTGTAATGAAIAGAMVTAVDAAGAATTATTGSDGRFSLAVSGSAPYALRVTDASGQVWYSYAQAAGTANITPLTTLALAEAAGGRPLAEVVAQWSGTRLDAAAVLAAAGKVNANLQALMQAKGVDFTRANVFADPFSADGTGLDAVLDAMRVRFSCSATACSQEILTPQGTTLLAWRGDILTTGIALSWSGSDGGTGAGGGIVVVGVGSCKAPVPGSYSLVVATEVSGLPMAVPEVCIDGLPEMPASQDEFCGAAQVQGQLPTGVSITSCSFSGNQGRIGARISSPMTLDYSVTYTYVRIS